MNSPLRLLQAVAITFVTLLTGMAGAASPAFSLLHSFSRPTDGGGLLAGVILDADGNLYGTTSSGGVNNHGTIFKVRIDGTGFAVLHSFSPAPNDGANPEAALIMDENGILYGTTFGGGANSYGTVFRVSKSGAGFSLLHSFSAAPSDGEYPGALVLDAIGDLYGTTSGGGANGGCSTFVTGCGTIFKIKTDGTGFTLIHSFSGSSSDGSIPSGGLNFDGIGNLYGTTASGGATDNGTIFKIKTDGTGLTLLHSFSTSSTDGIGANADLLLDADGSLYGTSTSGGESSGGTIFKISTSGTGFALIHSFSGLSTDGAAPQAGLVLDSAGTLYGTSELGGTNGVGTVFKIDSDGTGFTLLHSFSVLTSDGDGPEARLVLDGGGNLYGTTLIGGATGGGTVFKVVLPATTARRRNASAITAVLPIRITGRKH